MNRTVRLLRPIPLLALVAAVACGGRMVTGADFDPAVGMGEPRTFSWGLADELPVGDPRLDQNPFFVNRMHAAIERELAARGVRYVELGGDLLVHHHAAVRSRVDVLRVDEQAGYSQAYGQGPATELYRYDEGTFLVDVADRRTRRIVWRGWARADLMGTLDDAPRFVELLDRAVAGMFERFPLPLGRKPVDGAPELEPAPRIVEEPR